MIALAHPARHARHAPPPPPAPAAAQLLAALDALEHGFAFLERSGRAPHVSAAFGRALDDPAWSGLREEVARFTAALWGLANVRRPGAVVERLDTRSVRLPGGDCHLQGAYVGLDLFGGGASVLVSLRVPVEDPFALERLHARFALTRKQCRVARLLAEGLRNDEIARRLSISPHTARHHVEQIKLKVGAHTRAAVAARIRQAA